LWCIRNVVGHLTEEYQSAIRCKMRNAYAMREHADAKRGLDALLRELMDLNPSAAHSLEEGMEETLAVHRLRLPEKLRQTLRSTNPIESAFDTVETVCRNVKRWRWITQPPAWLRIHSLISPPDAELVAVLDRGEREAIQLLIEHRSSEPSGRPVFKERRFTRGMLRRLPAAIPRATQRRRAWKPSCSKWWSFVRISVIPWRRMVVIDTQSTRLYPLSKRCSYNRSPARNDARDCE